MKIAPLTSSKSGIVAIHHRHPCDAERIFFKIMENYQAGVDKRKKRRKKEA